jgi:hypothetical protein
LVVNLLLQAIINANPHHDTTATPEKRLAKAREALLGEKPSNGRKAIQAHLKLFPLLEEALKTDRDRMLQVLLKYQKPEGREKLQEQMSQERPSFRMIAKKYAPEFSKPSVLPSSTEDWLRRAITDLSVTSQDMADLEGLFRGDSAKAERLRRIFADLRALGIASSDPLGRNGPI